ncbi:replication initiator [Sinosporangium siamense]|uniref:Replication initiation protein n=1 Tax=Sinosporangium siamense TaxID=1367973 RepID=A0A919V9U7_9ACTN|nr:replication initiator [Sinosporangium siamense]GII95778.1 replication initiation protein [Sinosporangium siamense]
MPTSATNAHAIHGMIARLNHPQYDRWAAQVRKCGGCRQPVRLRGKVEHYDRATGRLLHRYSTHLEPDGFLRVPCKTRRASRCPACAEIYRADTYHLIRAGLTGGKGVPESVATHPCLFVTLTAPSFGPVHTHRDGKPCRPRRDAPTCPHSRLLSCMARHSADDPRLGEPVCSGCYDYPGSVLFNSVAPLLWKRFTDALRGRVAKLIGSTLRDLRRLVTVAFAKVAEFQRRGVVHLHAVIRLDGPDGPTSTPRARVETELLTQAVRQAAGAVTATIPATTGQPARVLRWGDQLDVRPITLAGELTRQAVAGYIAKYATKAAESTGTLDRRIHPLEDLTALAVRDHVRRLIAECFRLSEDESLAHLRLAEWAHMLGYRGHFSTRSRHYSTTLGEIRVERIDHLKADAVAASRLPHFDEDTALKIASWTYAGSGLSPGEQLLTASLTGHFGGRV